MGKKLTNSRLNVLYRAYKNEACSSLPYLLRVILKDSTLGVALEEADLYANLGALRAKLDGGMLSYSYSIKTFIFSVGARRRRTDARKLRKLKKVEVNENEHACIRDKNAGKKL